MKSLKKVVKSPKKVVKSLGGEVAEEGGEVAEEGGEVAEEGGESSECPADSIAGIASGLEDFSTLVTALSAAGLVETFCAPGDYTVFAPTNDAFDASPGTLDAVLADEALLTAILTYHVAGGSLFAADVVTLTEITTLNGATISVEVTDAGVVLNGTVNIIQTDIEASNGVIHIIDGVLLLLPEVKRAARLPKKVARSPKKVARLPKKVARLPKKVARSPKKVARCRRWPECEGGGEVAEEGGESSQCPADSIAGIASSLDDFTTLVTARLPPDW